MIDRLLAKFKKYLEKEVPAYNEGDMRVIKVEREDGPKWIVQIVVEVYRSSIRWKALEAGAGGTTWTGSKCIESYCLFDNEKEALDKMAGYKGGQDQELGLTSLMITDLQGE